MLELLGDAWRKGDVLPGRHAQVERDPAAARAVLAAGHEIGSHTCDHLDHEQVPAAAAVSDMLDGAAAIERVLGCEPSCTGRPTATSCPRRWHEAARARLDMRGVDGAGR